MKILEENFTENDTEDAAKQTDRRIRDGVVFATMRKRQTVVCFRGSGMMLISEWYTERAKTEK